MFEKIKKVASNPAKIFLYLGGKGMLDWMSDRCYIPLAYRARMGKRLNADNPQTYNEKLQWIKLNVRDDRYTKLVDKYEVKPIVASIIGEEYIIPTLGVYDDFDDIDFDSLPDQFVLKCNHDSGGIVVCKDKSRLDKAAARAKLNGSLKKNYYKSLREWPYENVRPRIIAEKYMEDSESAELRDYKFFCFDGEVKALFIASDRMTQGVETKFDFFDENFNHLPFTNGHPNAAVPPKKPSQFELMKKLASKLSKGFPHVRVDFYEVDGKVYFGEMTFFHWSGMTPFVPEKWDYTFGSWIKLPGKHNI